MPPGGPSPRRERYRLLPGAPVQLRRQEMREITPAAAAAPEALTISALAGTFPWRALTTILSPARPARTMPRSGASREKTRRRAGRADGRAKSTGDCSRHGAAGHPPPMQGTVHPAPGQPGSTPGQPERFPVPGQPPFTAATLRELTVLTALTMLPQAARELAASPRAAARETQSAYPAFSLPARRLTTVHKDAPPARSRKTAVRPQKTAVPGMRRI